MSGRIPPHSDHLAHHLVGQFGAHVWGYRNYETSDDSTNNVIVGLLSNGEGWHNNHHADPRSAHHGHHWWEFDVSYLTIRLLGVLGLATKIAEPRKHSH